MDFSWTEEQLQLREEVVRFARRELNEAVRDLDEREEFNRRAWEKCSAYGLTGLAFPREYGGGGADPLTTVCALEALGYGCRDNGLLMSLHAHLWGCMTPVFHFGSEEQRACYLPRLASGEWIGGIAAAEPEAGSDVKAVKTRAERRGDRYVLSGTKTFVTNGPQADLLVVLATLDPSRGMEGITAFLVETAGEGLRRGPRLEKMGLRSSPMCEIHLDGCEVTEANRLGGEGAGLPVFNTAMEWERGLILSTAVGAMERLLEGCLEYARQRRQFDQPIGKFQLVSSRVAEMKLRLETARLLSYRFAWLKSQGRSALLEACLAKLYTSEAWLQSALDAVQIHGGYGYMKDLELEREVRDAVGSRLYSGTSEIQKVLIAQLLGL